MDMYHQCERPRRLFPGTLESGRAVAFMMDDALLAGERAKAKKPDNWEIVGTAQSKEAYGCMLRKDDAEFKTE